MSSILQKKQAQAEKIKGLAQKWQVDILAHRYARNEVKEVADFVGGSEELLAFAKSSRAKALMFCGVSFLCEAIEAARPDLPMLWPRRDAGCPLAEALGPQDYQRALEKYPDALLLADIKASLEIKEMADILISPSTAQEIFSALDGRKIIMAPGAYLAEVLGYEHLLAHKWSEAVCKVHEQALPEDLLAAKNEHPQALVLANILCLPLVRQMADYVGDSYSLWQYAADSPASEFIIVSEASLTESLAENFPHKNFYETAAEIYCPNMKITSLKAMLEMLEKFAAQRVVGKELPDFRGGEIIFQGATQ